MIRRLFTFTRDHRRRLQDRLTLFIALAVMVGIAITGAAAYAFTVTSTYEQLDNELIGVASLASRSLQADLETMETVDVTHLQAANVVVQVLRADNTAVGGPSSTPIRLEAAELAVARTGLGASARTGVGATGDQYRIIAVPLSARGSHYALILARPLAPTQAIINSLLGSLLFFGLAAIMAAAFAGYGIARATIAPLHKLRDHAGRVTATNKLEPVEVTRDDEVGELGRAFNRMLAALDTSRSRQQRLIADAGHELRTPLTSMRTNVELLVADENSGMLPPGARADILRDVAGQLGEFTTLVGDLVHLSREDAAAPAFSPLDVYEVTERALARVKRRSKPGMTWQVSLDNHLLLDGSPDSLERAITNLLDNAVKFSPDGATVHVALHDDRLRVADEGPGILDDDLPHVFERFYRSDQARTTPGSGLGLSIVAQIVESHGGWVKAGHAPEGGAEFVMRLPGRVKAVEAPEASA